MRTRICVLAAAAGLVLGARGDDDDGDDQPYVDALVASFTSERDEDLQLTQEQAECVAPRWIDTIGMERLEEAGVAPADIGGEGGSELADLGLTKAEGNELYDAFRDCEVDIKQAFIDGIAASGDLSAEVVTCLDEQFDDDTLRRILVVTITEGDDAWQDDEELTSVLLAAFSECQEAPAD